MEESEENGRKVTALAQQLALFCTGAQRNAILHSGKSMLGFKAIKGCVFAHWWVGTKPNLSK